MDRAELEKVKGGMNGKETTETGGLDHIALANVRKRISVLFGDDYGLDIESDVNGGTRVTVHLPLILSEKEKNDTDLPPDVLSSDRKHTKILPGETSK